MTYHIPVLADECIRGLAIEKNGTYLDVTAGGGGHSRLILEQLGEDGRLIAIDQDPDSPCADWTDPRFTFVHSNFSHMAKWLDYYEIDTVDGILADLGVSSHQIDEAQRGFAHKFDTTLDMRMNQAAGMTAADIIASYEQERLARIFWQYGDYKKARVLARSIVQQRDHSPIVTSTQLNALVEPLHHRHVKKELSRIYQALRIEVNGEMEVLDHFLAKATKRIRTGGRLVVMSYHSLEDRKVKQCLRPDISDDGFAGSIYEEKVEHWKLITRKAIQPSQKEQEQNPRSRSARLRIAQRL